MSSVHPLTFQQILRADFVKRWQIVAVSRQQSVAEHTHNVTTIAREIFKRFLANANVRMDAPTMAHWVAGIHEAAYLHDLAEVETGDIHSNAKRMLGIGKLVADTEGVLLRGHALATADGSSEFPIDTVIKLADLMDAVRYLGLWGTGRRAVHIRLEIENSIKTMMTEINNENLHQAVLSTFYDVHGEI